jgi:hypothetical protein
MKTQKLSALLIVLLAVTLVACGGKNASTPTDSGKKDSALITASTPTNAFKSFYEAAKTKDVATLKKLLAKDSLSKMEDKAKQANKSLDDYIGEQTQSGIPPSMPETRNEKIDGDKATIEFKGPGGETDWRTVPFAKEDGEWKVLFK